MQEVLGTDDVACVIDAKHLCVNSRGIRDIESSTVTSEFGGKFKEKETRRRIHARRADGRARHNRTPHHVRRD